MSRETDVRVDYKLVDITAAADGVLSMPNIQTVLRLYGASGRRTGHPTLGDR